MKKILYLNESTGQYEFINLSDIGVMNKYKKRDILKNVIITYNLFSPSSKVEFEVFGNSEKDDENFYYNSSFFQSNAMPLSNAIRDGHLHEDYFNNEYNLNKLLNIFSNYEDYVTNDHLDEFSERSKRRCKYNKLHFTTRGIIKGYKYKDIFSLPSFDNFKQKKQKGSLGDKMDLDDDNDFGMMNPTKNTNTGGNTFSFFDNSDTWE